MPWEIFDHNPRKLYVRHTQNALLLSKELRRVLSPFDYARIEINYAEHFALIRGCGANADGARKIRDRDGASNSISLSPSALSKLGMQTKVRYYCRVDDECAAVWSTEEPEAYR